MTVVNEAVSTTHFYFGEWDYAVKRLSGYSGVSREFVEELRDEFEGSRVGMLDMVHEVAEESCDSLVKRVDADKGRVSLMKIRPEGL